MSVQTSSSAKSLISGYESYVNDGELNDFLALGGQTAPAVSPTPSILSFIGGSSATCGTAASIITGSAVGTIAKGC